MNWIEVEFLVILEYYLDKKDLRNYSKNFKFFIDKIFIYYYILSLFYLNNIQESRETLNSDRNA